MRELRKSSSVLAFLFGLYFLFPTSANAVEKITLIVTDGVLRDYQLLLNGRDPLTIDQYEGVGSRRDVVEVLLILQALHAGGFTAQAEFQTANSYKRIQRQLSEGQVTMSGNSLWKKNLEELGPDILISDAIIEEGEFVCGLYTLPDNYKVLAVKTPKELRELSSVSNPEWTPDWEALESLHLKELMSISEYRMMVKMLERHRVDFILTPFTTEFDLHYQYLGTTMVPIKNLKLILHGTRHFFISTHDPRAQQILVSLNKGIKILRAKGVIYRAYEQSGFFNEKVKNWRALNARK